MVEGHGGSAQRVGPLEGWGDNLRLRGGGGVSQGPACMLVRGTYRPADVLWPGHPLHAVVHELKMHKRGDELSLSSLTKAAVEEYLTARFPATTVPHRCWRPPCSSLGCRARRLPCELRSHRAGPGPAPSDGARAEPEAGGADAA